MATSEGVPSEFFRAIYAGQPPWDIGAPQPSIQALAAEGFFHGRVLDVGCGAGDNAIALARAGLDVWGVDLVPSAIDEARRRAEGVAPTIRFTVGDALDLAALGTRFDSAIDSGLFHVFSDDDRPRFVASLASALMPGAHFALLCFSDAQVGSQGPRRVTEAELRTAFAEHFRVDRIEATRFLTRSHPDGAHAWLARFVRI